MTTVQSTDNYTSVHINYSIVIHTTIVHIITTTPTATTIKVTLPTTWR